MNSKTWIPLSVAVVLGLAAAWVARTSLKTQPAVATSTNMVALVVAARDVQPGSALAAADLQIGHMAADSAPAQSFADIKQVIGRVNTVTLAKGQPVMQTLLAPAGAGAGLQALVPANMRAMTIEVNEFSGLAGLVIPGCRVDLISTLHDSRTNELLTKTIVQDVQVTAVGQKLTPPSQSGAVSQVGQSGAAAQEPFRSVTLLVTPEDAEIIQLASASGRPYLALRGQEDWGAPPRQSPGITLAELRGPMLAHDDPFTNNPAPAAVRPAQVASAVAGPRDTTEPWTVRMYLGGEESSKVFMVEGQK